MQKKTFVETAVAAHQARRVTASSMADIKQTVRVINSHIGSKLEINEANGGYQLVDAGTSRKLTGHIKPKDLLRFVGGFAAGVSIVKKQAIATAKVRVVVASSEDDTNHEFTSAVLALAVTEGVNDSFTGVDDGIYYACVDFTPEVQQSLKTAGFAQAEAYSGVIMVFQDGEFSDDVDAAAFNFFVSSTEYEAEWTKVEESVGGRVDEDADDDTDDEGTEEDTDSEDDEEEERTEADDAADTAVISLLDSDECPEADDSAESEDQSQQYSLYRAQGLFLDKLKSLPATSEYCEDMVGVIYWYGKEEGESDFSESVTWYSDEDLMNSDWADITGQSGE